MKLRNPKTPGKTSSPRPKSSWIKNPFAFWAGLSAETRRAVKFVVGLVALFLALLVAIAVTSYIFTWEKDQSLIYAFAHGEKDLDAANFAGTLGARIAHLLVTRLFGLGAYAVVAFLLLAAGKLLSVRNKGSYLRIFTITLTGALLSSYVLALFSWVTGLDNVFSSGLGGDSGMSAVLWLQTIMGVPMIFVFLFLLCVVWLFFTSSSFARMLSRKQEEAQEAAEEDAEEDVKEDVPVQNTGKTFKWWPSRKSTAEDTDVAVEDPGTVEECGAVEERVAVPENHGDEKSPADEEIKVKAERPEVEAEAGAEEADNKAGDRTDGRTGDRTDGQTDGRTGNRTDDQTDGQGQVGNDVPEIIEGQELTTDVKTELPNINVKDELKDYQMPGLSLLDDYANMRYEVPEDELRRNNIKICHALNTYGIQVSDVKAAVGPTVTLYKVYPAPGVRVSQIKNLSDDIALALQVKGVRIITLPDAVGIEVPNDRRSVVPLKAMLNDDSFRHSEYALPIAIGYTITQQVKVFDLADAPHLLVAGATKQGKSVGLNVIISSLLYSKHPSQLKLVFIDPKMVEFSAYARLLKHYLAVLPTAAGEDEEKANAIVKKPKQAAEILKSLCIEMDERYELLSKAMVNDVRPYNKKYESRHLLPTEGHKYLPYLVVVVDEYADLTMSAGGSGEAKTMAREISTSIIRLAQKGRAAGIHMVIATQRPSVDVITGTIKTNFPMRIAFRTVSSVDSKTILDMPGAEKLIGKGDMLFYAGVDVERVQCAFISNDEIMKVTSFIEEQDGYKKSYNTPYYLPAPAPDQSEEGGSLIDMKDLDARFVEAAKLVVTSQRGSTSDLQRRLGMGYAKAGRVMDQLEAAGIVGPQEGSKPRQVLVPDLNSLDEILNAYINN